MLTFILVNKGYCSHQAFGLCVCVCVCVYGGGGVPTVYLEGIQDGEKQDTNLDG